MIPNVTLSSERPLSKGKHECRVQFMIMENVRVDFGEACQLPLLFIARYNIGRGFSLSMISKLKPENGLSSNCTYSP